MKGTSSEFSWSRLAMVATIAVLALALLIPILRGTSPIALGLDLSGGVFVTYRPDFSRALDAYRDVPREELLGLAKETLASRLYRKLSTVPDVVVRSDQAIVVSVPSHSDYRQVLDLMGETWNLTLRLVVAQHDAAGDPAAAEPELFPYRGRFLELAPARFSGDMLDERSLRVETGSSGAPRELAPSPRVTFRFRPPHDAAFARFTGDNVGRQLAILIDDKVEWSGVIESAITGSGVLAGSHNLEEATEIARMLRSGTLPVSLEVESLTAVGPSLGQEIRDLGLHALGLALVLLLVFLAVAYFHRSGFLAAGILSLGCLLFLTAGLVAALDLTVDLVGIAGLILSVGMGMDAFIIVFESVDGKLRAADPSAGGTGDLARRVAGGIYSFRGEGQTLFHANATTLLVISLLLTTERLKSFALFIFVGTAASVLTIFVTRAVLSRMPGRLSRTRPDLLGWLRRARPGVFRLRRLYFAGVIAALILTSLLMAVGPSSGPALSFGADFREGIQAVVSSPDEARVRAALERLGELRPEAALRYQVLGAAEDGHYLATLGTSLTPEIAGQISQVFAGESVAVDSLTSIDSKVSSRRLLGSLSVLGLSFVLLAIYFVALQGPIDRLFGSGRVKTESRRIRWWVFTGILLAVVADLAVILTVLAWLRIPISLPVVAGMLTIVGYSVNDSVVLWSHVRSLRNELWKAREDVPAGEIVHRAVDNILSRAFLTSVSTLVPAWTILIVGLTPLADFARVMITGTVAGTLSSLFVVGSFAVRALRPCPGVSGHDRTAVQPGWLASSG